jgi:hypothetical protein
MSSDASSSTGSDQLIGLTGYFLDGHVVTAEDSVLGCQDGGNSDFNQYDH